VQIALQKIDTYTPQK